MQIISSRYSMFIDESAMNTLAENPFKFPRPEKTPGKVVTPGEEAGTTITRPSVTFEQAMEFVYTHCTKYLLRKLRAGMLEAFERYGSEENPISNFKCGDKPVQGVLYSYPWEFRCQLQPLRPGLIAEDIEMILVDTDPEYLKQYFTLHIESAILKYRTKNQPLQVKGRDLHSQRTK